jgi:hypothetical protein
MIAQQITTVEWAIGIGAVAVIAFALAVVAGRRSRGSAGLGLSERLSTGGTEWSAGCQAASRANQKVF